MCKVCLSITVNFLWYFYLQISCEYMLFYLCETSYSFMTLLSHKLN